MTNSEARQNTLTIAFPTEGLGIRETAQCVACWTDLPAGPIGRSGSALRTEFGFCCDDCREAYVFELCSDGITTFAEAVAAADEISRKANEGRA
jgi:hypothetical protein